MFEVYLGEWYMASGETAEQAMENALSVAYAADLIGKEPPRLSEGEFMRSVVYTRQRSNACLFSES